MAVKDDVAGLFEQEWARFWEGWQALSPEEQELEAARRARARSRSGLPNTVSLPGWDDVIHLTPRPTITDAERREYYAAFREQRPSDLSAETVAEIDRRRERAARAASSSAPPYSAAFGQMLTALDNVQDFTTTVATLGRVALWPAIRALDAVTPRFATAGALQSIFGATPAATQQLARVASQEAAALAYRQVLTESLAGRLAAAASGIEALTLRQVAREAAEDAARLAGRAAFERVLSRAGLGIAARTLGRLIPGLGWILLAGDLFNLLAWLGTLGMVGYAGACFGPRAALAAGTFPALTRGLPGVRPCGIKGHVSALGDLNPFAGERRLDRRAKIARANPGLGALLEVFQTTDQLFGRGISFGAIVGAFTEGAYSTELASRGESVSVVAPRGTLGVVGVATGVAALQLRSKALGAAAAGTLLADVVGRTATAPLREKHKAAQVLQNGPVLNGTQETFTEVEHVEALVCYLVALDLIASDLAGIPWQDFLTPELPVSMAPPVYHDALTLDIIRELDPGLDTLGRWPMPGAPRVIDSATFADHFAREIPAALRSFLAPRRDGPVAMFHGGLVNLVTDKLWAMLEGDPWVVRQRWSPEWKVLTALGEASRLPNVAAGEEALWSWWLDLLELVERRGDGQLLGEDFDRVSAQRGVPLFLVEQPLLHTPLVT
jgi:hypothetical protein